MRNKHYEVSEYTKTNCKIYETTLYNNDKTVVDSYVNVYGTEEVIFMHMYNDANELHSEQSKIWYTIDTRDRMSFDNSLITYNNGIIHGKSIKQHYTHNCYYLKITDYVDGNKTHMYTLWSPNTDRMYMKMYTFSGNDQKIIEERYLTKNEEKLIMIRSHDFEWINNIKWK